MKEQIHLSNLSQFERMSLRGISEHTGHHFTTVKKYVDCEDWNAMYRPRKERVSLLEPLKPTIDQWIMQYLRAVREKSLSTMTRR